MHHRDAYLPGKGHDQRWNRNALLQLEATPLYGHSPRLKVLGGHQVSHRHSSSDSFWNVDYVDALALYPLKAINRMESEFVSLCNYNLFVSADLYTQYYMAVREISNQIYTTPQSPVKSKTFNRFKDPVEEPEKKRMQKIEGNPRRLSDAVAESSFKEARTMSLHNSKIVPSAAPENLPVFYLPTKVGDEGPMYPSLKISVHQYQQEVADILEESMEERRAETQNQTKGASKIKMLLNSPSKRVEDQNPQQAPLYEDTMLMKIEGSQDELNPSLDFNIVSLQLA